MVGNHIIFGNIVPSPLPFDRGINIVTLKPRYGCIFDYGEFRHYDTHGEREAENHLKVIPHCFNFC